MSLHPEFYSIRCFMVIALSFCQQEVVQMTEDDVYDKLVFIIVLGISNGTTCIEDDQLDMNLLQKDLSIESSSRVVEAVM